MPSKHPTRTPYDHATTAGWHKPACSHCGEPIDQIEKAYAGWYEDEAGRAHDPFVVHTGDLCPFYAENEHAGLADLPVTALRRAPMQAIMVATRHRADEAERRTWHLWVSCVLGLPLHEPDELITMMALEDRRAEILPNRVPTVPEMRARLSSQ